MAELLDDILGVELGAATEGRHIRGEIVEGQDPSNAASSKVAPTRRGKSGHSIVAAVLEFDGEHCRDEMRIAFFAWQSRASCHRRMVGEIRRQGRRGEEVGFGHDRGKRRRVGSHTGDSGGAQSCREAAGGRLTLGVVTDHLREQRVVVGRDDASLADTGVDADRLAFGPTTRAADPEVGDPSSRRQPLVGRILCDDPNLDRVTVDRDIGLSERQRSAFGDAELEFDEIEAGHGLGHRVLDLQSGVHLEEGDRRLVRAALRVSPSGSAGPSSPTMNSTVPAPT